MHSHPRIIIGSLITISIAMILTLGLHVGGAPVLKFSVYSPLLGAFIGGSLVLVSIYIPIRQDENVEPWARYEKLSWTLIGAGCIAWGIGECFWRYYIAHGESPFPSLADIGYASFLPLVFPGLLLQKGSANPTSRRMFLLLDSLIATGVLLSIGWFLLLGPLAQSPAQSFLAKFLGLYYAMADITLLSCTIFLLLRGDASKDTLKNVRGLSLLLVGVGLAVYATSDFSFNAFQNMGLPVDISWINLGWPLGMMTLGIAGYVRRFFPRENTSSAIEKQGHTYRNLSTFPFSQAVPYFLLLLLFIVLSINVLQDTPLQEAIRPVLISATILVVFLVMLRQLILTNDNTRLMREQEVTLAELAQIYQDVENRQQELEIGISYLKEIQTRLANGDVRARAHTLHGDLWPLAHGLNVMADRMMRAERNQRYAQKVIKAISDLNLALEQSDGRKPFVLPTSCLDVHLELNRLLQITVLKRDLKVP